jgi:hypothetical protein
VKTSRSRTLRIGIIGALALAAASVVVVATAPQPKQHQSTAPQIRATNIRPDSPVIANGLQALPTASIEDWASYADLVVSGTVRRISRGELSPDEQAAGEGLAVRFVEVAVDNVVWSAAGSPPPPVVITIPAGGWLVKNGTERRMYIGNTVDFEIGHRYLMPIYYNPAAKPVWQGLGSTTAMPFDGDIIGNGETIRYANAAGPARNALWGLPRAGVAQLLRGAKADPLAVRYAGLPAPQRYQAVLKARGPVPLVLGPGES